MKQKSPPNKSDTTAIIAGEDITYSYEIKIPKERIAVLIGKNGRTKREMEEQLQVSMQVDSSEGDVTIIGRDALLLMNGREVVKAVGRGFNPATAMFLTKPDYTLEIIDLGVISRNTNDLARLKGRIIGAGGKSRRVIEGLTNSSISVYGKTVSIIAEMDQMLIARHAVGMLIEGSCHRNVYAWLERQRRMKNI